MHLSAAVISTVACATLAAAQVGRYDRRGALSDVRLDEHAIHARAASALDTSLEERLYARDLNRRLARAQVELEYRDLLYLQHLLRRKDKDKDADKDVADEPCDDCDDDDASAKKPQSEQDKNKEKDKENKKKDGDNKKKDEENKKKSDSKAEHKAEKKAEKKEKKKAKAKAKAKAKEDASGENDDVLTKPDVDEDVWDPQEDNGKGKKGSDGKKKKVVKVVVTKKVTKQHHKDLVKAKAKAKGKKAEKSKAKAADDSKEGEPEITFYDSKGKVVADVGGGVSFKSYTNNALHIDRQAAKDGPSIKEAAAQVSTKHMKDSKAVLKLWDNDKAEGKPVLEVKGKDLDKEKLPKGVKSFTLERG